MRRFFQYFIAIFLIGAGIMLVLANIGIMDFGFRSLWHYVYPVFILVLGLKWMFDYFRKRGTHWFLGIFFTVFGGLLFLDRFEVLTFYFTDVVKLWPLFIIYFGFVLIGFGRGRRYIHILREGSPSLRKRQDMTVKTQNFTIGSQEYSEPNWKVEPMNINTLAGDFYLDFSKAFIPEKEIPIFIHSLAGDVHILIPENVDFRIEANVKVGDINVIGNVSEGISRSYSYETDNYEEAVRKIDFYIQLKAGSIRVDQV